MSSGSSSSSSSDSSSPAGSTSPGPPPSSATRSGSRGSPPFVPESIPSVVTPDDLSLIRIQYGIPNEFDLQAPGSGGRASSPPSGWFCLYLETLRAGLRLPLPAFVVTLFKFLNISLASVVPNSFRFLIGFLSLCQLAEVQPSLSLFRNFYTFKHHASARDWWFISPQTGRKGLLRGAPSSVHGWKEKFFFVRCMESPLNLPPWGFIRESARRAPSLGIADIESSNKLKGYQVPHLSELLKEQTLFAFGLSPVNPSGTTDASFPVCLHT